MPSEPVHPQTPVRRIANRLVKLEALQPGGSHKARAARFILRRAIAEGALTPFGERRILEKSGGNLGVGLAFEAARLGIGVDLVIGLSFSRVKRALCIEYGATMVGEDLLERGFTPKEVIARMLEEHPETYVFTDQFANEANLAAHLEETGPELVAQIRAEIAPGQSLILVKGAGTGASFQGIATRLREHFDDLRCILVMPPDCDLSGERHRDHPLEGFAVGVRPPFLDAGLVDAIRVVDGEDARAGQRAMARDIGFYPGMSSGANYAAASRIAAENPQALVVTLAYDSGESYLPRPMQARTRASVPEMVSD